MGIYLSIYVHLMTSKNRYPQKLLSRILDIIMLMLLAKFEFDRWFYFPINKELLKQNGFPLKPDDVIVMSSNIILKVK